MKDQLEQKNPNTGSDGKDTDQQDPANPKKKTRFAAGAGMAQAESSPTDGTVE